MIAEPAEFHHPAIQGESSVHIRTQRPRDGLQRSRADAGESLHAVSRVLVVLLLLVHIPASAQSPPETPQVQNQVETNHAFVGPCPDRDPARGTDPIGLVPNHQDVIRTTPSPNVNAQNPCPSRRHNWYVRFLDGPQRDPRTPREKAWLASRNLADPFELMTIAGDSVIATGLNAHSAYGPGMTGFGGRVGVSFTEEMTVEFVDTFAICSLAHQNLGIGS